MLIPYSFDPVLSEETVVSCEDLETAANLSCGFTKPYTIRVDKFKQWTEVQHSGEWPSEFYNRQDIAGKQAIMDSYGTAYLGTAAGAALLAAAKADALAEVNANPNANCLLCPHVTPYPTTSCVRSVAVTGGFGCATRARIGVNSLTELGIQCRFEFTISVLLTCDSTDCPPVP